MAARKRKKQRPKGTAATPETVATGVSALLGPLIEDAAAQLMQRGADHTVRLKIVSALTQALDALLAGHQPKAGPGAAGPRFLLRKELGSWRLIFDGKESVIRDCRGMELVAYLLKNPPAEPMHAVRLEAKVAGHDHSSNVNAEMVNRDAVIQEASGGHINGGGNKILNEKLKELMAAKDDVTLPESERQQAQEEIEELIRANKRGGPLATAASRAAERVGKALKRLRQRLASAELKPGEPNGVLRSFGEHLHRHILVPSMRYSSPKARQSDLRSPGCFTYERPPEIVWAD